ncbi:EpsG family protein [Metabacillus herbersteinensis]|uniref:EpsG family protein n=1 Tax=Metabacillus herbersteinensis TaxID=283816 RepID=A0ABV6G8F0_9BACI
MTIMWINLTLVYMFSSLSRYFSKPLSLTSNFVKPNKLFVFFAITSLVVVSGLRNNIGDTGSYMHSYSIKSFNLENINYLGDFGFDMLQMILQLFSSDPQLLIIFTAVTTNLLIAMSLYKYSRMFEISLYVYITAGMFTTSMNGIRQYLAAAIIFSATKYLLNGNFKKYFLIVLIASTFHKSALVLIPIYFIVRREAWTKVTFFLLFISIIIVISFNQFSELLFATLDSTQYGHYSDFSEGGANFIRVAVNATPIIIAFFGRHKLRELWPKSDYIVNLSIISAMFIIISTQNWIFARFNIYFDLYNLILISWIAMLFKERNKKFICYGILVLYFCYYYYEHVITYGLVYKSNYLNF